MIIPDLVFLVAFVYVVSLFLKKLPAFKAEWMIPLVLWLLAIVAALLVLAIHLGKSFTPATIMTAVALFGNQIFKQIADKRLDDQK